MGLLQQVYMILPEMILGGGILFILVVDLFIKRKSQTLYLSVSLIIYLTALYWLFNIHFDKAQYLFYGNLHSDGISFFIRTLLLFTGMIAVIISYKNPELKSFLPGEYQMLIMGSILGGMFMSMASNMIMIYLAIEFVSLLSYLLTAVKIKNSKAYEGAIKYMLFGAVASGVLLFGMSYIYGVSGTLDIAGIGKTLKSVKGTERMLVWAGFAFVFGGLAYKIAAAPFHAWCPDVYEGAATPVTTFFSVGPKIAGFAVIMRFYNEIFASGEIVSQEKIFLLIGLVSAVTMTIGNLSALMQKNIKRLFAYSSIAHAGYILAGFSAFSTTANRAVLFYLMAYLIMNSGVFLVAIAVGTKKELSTSEGMGFDSFSGLAYKGRSGAFWAFIMTIFLFSLTGIPPFVGFIGKYYIFTALLEKEIYWLALIGVINTVISLYYYALILKAMYFDKVDEDNLSDEDILKTPLYSLLGVALVILTLVLGVFPSLITLP